MLWVGNTISSPSFAFSLYHIALFLEMAVSFSYWDDCAGHQDLEAMWNVPKVSAEWFKAGEAKGRKIHLSRDPDGQPYLTQTEMRAVADIVITRHFKSQIDPGMICAIAELESDRQLLVMHTCRKSKEPTVGLMQLLPKTAEWLTSELGYRSYTTGGDIGNLFKPFINVYFAAAYIKWLSHFDKKERNEEFIVRAYKGGPKKATSKSTLHYWKSYLSVKETFPTRKSIDDGPPPSNAQVPTHSHAGSPRPPSEKSKDKHFAVSTEDPVVDTYWDSKASSEDMEAMWNHPAMRKVWTKSKEKPGKVRFSQDEKKRAYLSRVEMKAVADIILFKHLTSMKIKSTVICAIGEVASMRFVDGVGKRPGIMGIDYSTAFWLYLEMGYRAYKLETVEDLSNPFVSMYFGAAYVAWLSEYEGRERPAEFFVQAYFVGPKNVNPQDTSTLWLKYEEALSRYEEERKRHGESCTIM